MKEMMRFVNDECGQGMLEYGLIISLIALVVIAALPLIADRVIRLLQPASDALGA